MLNGVRKFEILLEFRIVAFVIPFHFDYQPANEPRYHTINVISLAQCNIAVLTCFCAVFNIVA